MRLPVPTAFEGAARIHVHESSGLLRRALFRTGCTAALVLVLFGCDRADDARRAVEQAASSASETLHSVTTPGPATVLERMLTRARSGDWPGYVAFYGEADKLHSDADRQALIHRFETEWGRRVVNELELAEGVTPVIQGDRAVFNGEDGAVFVLYRGKDGQWGFHL